MKLNMDQTIRTAISISAAANMVIGFFSRSEIQLRSMDPSAMPSRNMESIEAKE